MESLKKKVQMAGTRPEPKLCPESEAELGKHSRKNPHFNRSLTISSTTFEACWVSWKKVHAIFLFFLIKFSTLLNIFL